MNRSYDWARHTAFKTSGVTIEPDTKPMTMITIRKQNEEITLLTLKNISGYNQDGINNLNKKLAEEIKKAKKRIEKINHY